MTDKPDEKEVQPEQVDFTKGLTVGRVVHVVADGGQCVAAIVSAVIAKDRGLITVHCLIPTFSDTEPKLAVIKAMPSAEHTPGSWHWPEFVP